MNTPLHPAVRELVRVIAREAVRRYLEEIEHEEQPAGDIEADETVPAQNAEASP